MSFRATYYVTIMLDAPVNAENFEEAIASAKKKTWNNLVKGKPGVEVIDHQVQLYGVNDLSSNGEM